MEPKKYKVMLNIAGGFYALLCVFSIVVGLMYATGQHELNTIELSESMLEKLSDPEALQRFTVSMGWVTFAVGIDRAGNHIFGAVQETRKGQLLHRSWVHCLFALFCRIQNNRTLQSVCINKNHSLCGDPHRFTASRFERTVLEKVRRRKAVTGNF